MIPELAAALGIPEHTLFAAISRISGRGMTLSWERDAFPFQDDQLGMILSTPANWAVLTIVGPIDQVEPVARAACAVAERLHKVSA